MKRYFLTWVRDSKKIAKIWWQIQAWIRLKIAILFSLEKGRRKRLIKLLSMYKKGTIFHARIIKVRLMEVESKEINWMKLIGSKERWWGFWSNINKRKLVIWRIRMLCRVKLKLWMSKFISSRMKLSTWSSCWVIKYENKKKKKGKIFYWKVFFFFN